MADLGTKSRRTSAAADGKTILMVEDDPGVLETLEAILRRRGHDVMRARDGVEALALLGTRMPDLILCDRIMPRMSGYELLEVIRAERPDLAAVPFVFLTVLGDQRDILATDPLAPAAYIAKPVRARTLVDTVDRLIGARDPHDLGADEDTIIADHAA